MRWIHYVVGIIFVKAVGHSTCPLALPLDQCVQRLLADATCCVRITQSKIQALADAETAKVEQLHGKNC